MSLSGVILAAGKGTRFGSGESKVWAIVAGRPVLGHAVEALESYPGLEELVVVIGAGGEGRAQELAGDCGVPVQVITGGKRRQDSALAGLRAARGEYVLIHDGARPCLSPALIARVVAAARAHGAAVPAVLVSDTVRYTENGLLCEDAVDRSGLVLVQTPQGFRRDLLLRAYDAAERRGLDLPDDAAAIIAVGHPVATVPGDPANLKVTWPGDLAVAECVLAAWARRTAPSRRDTPAGEPSSPRSQAASP